MKLLVCVCVWTVVHRVHVNPWQMFQKLPKGHPSAVCEQSEALKQSSKHVSNRKNQPKSWSHMHWPFSSIPSTPSVEKLGENPTCHTERTRTRYKNQCKIKSKQCIMSSQPGVGTARTLSFHSAGLARAIPGKHFNPWSQPHPSTLAKGKTHLRLAMVGWILFFFQSFAILKLTIIQESWISKLAESQNLKIRLVDPQLFNLPTCGSTKISNSTFQILWIHNFRYQNFVDPQNFKVTLVDPQNFKNQCFSKKIEENRGELSHFFLMFEKMLKFSIEFDDFSNGASIAKPNTVPMFFVFFDFQVNLFFDFFLW